MSDGKVLGKLEQTPFLFGFLQPCTSPGRVQISSSYYYDEEFDIVRWIGREDHPPAVVASGEDAPKTKKADLEKGEDSKDRRMWG